MEQIIKRIARGEESALVELINIMQKRVFSYCYSLVGSYEDAEEITSDVFYQVWKSASKFKNLSTPTTWIFGIARNLCLNHLRKKKLHFQELFENDAIFDPIEEQELNATAEEIRQAISKLSPIQREILYLVFYEEMDYKSIAKFLDIPENTVKTRVFNAKKRLKEILSHERANQASF
ncbi:MAG: RNA polymerase sigma factor [Aquificaceae bacterium]|nr:RNA polymerase sigma factor [Aquificaceae bacterium]